MSDCSTHAFGVPLKPCPFCGGEAKTRLNDRWWIHCSNCTCEIGFEGMDENGYYGHFDTEAEAIAAWNTRAERTCHNKQKDVGMFECSACGISGITIKSWDLARVEPVRCPNCGARVVE